MRRIYLVHNKTHFLSCLNVHSYCTTGVEVILKLNWKLPRPWILFTTEAILSWNSIISTQWDILEKLQSRSLSCILLRFMTSYRRVIQNTVCLKAVDVTQLAWFEIYKDLKRTSWSVFKNFEIFLNSVIWPRFFDKHLSCILAGKILDRFLSRNPSHKNEVKENSILNYISKLNEMKRKHTIARYTGIMTHFKSLLPLQF